MPLPQLHGRGQVGRGHERRRVVLEPGQAPGAVEPDAAQEADLAHGGADVGRELAARGEHEEHVGRRRAKPRRHEDDRAHVRAPEDRPGERVPESAPPAGGRHGAVPPLPGLAPLPDEALADPGHAHLLARRCRRGHQEEVPSQPDRRRPAFLDGPFDPRPPGRSEGRRQREDGEHDERRVDRHQQDDGNAQPQDPAAGGEERHVHVVEHEHLVAQDRETVEVQESLLVGDRRDLRLQPRHVRLERDRDPVAEPALHAGADRAQEPCGRRRRAEAEGAGDQQSAVAPEHALPQELQPQGQEGVR